MKFRARELAVGRDDRVRPENTGHYSHQSPCQSLGARPSLHYRKLRGTRQTFILGAKISSFVEVLVAHVHVERDLDIWKHISHLFIPKKGLYGHQEC